MHTQIMTSQNRRRTKRLPRGVLKTISYSVMHLCVAMTIAYILTGNIKAALAIGLIEPAAQTLAYTLHEKAWARKLSLPFTRLAV